VLVPDVPVAADFAARAAAPVLMSWTVRPGGWRSQGDHAIRMLLRLGEGYVSNRSDPEKA